MNITITKKIFQQVARIRDNDLPTVHDKNTAKNINSLCRLLDHYQELEEYNNKVNASNPTEDITNMEVSEFIEKKTLDGACKWVRSHVPIFVMHVKVH